MSKLTYESYAPTRVLFGPGQLNHLHEQAMPGKKAMVVISNGKSTRANGSLDRALAELETAGVQTIVFDKVGANPTKEVVEAGAFLARDEHVDFVVALGGGSVMDAAKVMAMFAPQPGDDLWDYAGGKTGRRQPLVNPELPWIAITTTAGTGSEVDSAGVVTNLETREKIGIGSPNDFAQVAIVDPELMLSVPARFTAYQGFDALFHSLEGYISNQANPMSDMVQLAAIENIGTYLPRAVADGSDLEARAHVAFAKHDERILDGVLGMHVRALDGARDERLPPGAAPWRWPHDDQPGLLRLLDRPPRLRRALRAHGTGTGQEGRERALRLPDGPARPPGGLRRGTTSR
jgi:alcohol dehydrogenase